MTRILKAGRYELMLARPLVMGIVNVTPDSFAGGIADLDAAHEHALTLIDDGADILDIGGESTRPGAVDVGESEEIARVIPLIERLADCGRPLSIDTRKASVMGHAVAAGASIINDVNALRAAGAIEAAAESGAAVCLMHMQGDPQTMQSAPHYDDVVGEVTRFLKQRAEACVVAGIGRECIVVDPGFGFGKTVPHNLALLEALGAIAALGFPVLAGLSRKGMLGKLTGRPVGERVHGSVAAALAAITRGAAIVRVHDVAATVDAIAIWRAAGLVPGAHSDDWLHAKC